MTKQGDRDLPPEPVARVGNIEFREHAPTGRVAVVNPNGACWPRYLMCSAEFLNDMEVAWLEWDGETMRVRADNGAAVYRKLGYLKHADPPGFLLEQEQGVLVDPELMARRAEREAEGWR